jgi:hypothetical protein
VRYLHIGYLWKGLSQNAFQHFFTFRAVKGGAIIIKFFRPGPPSLCEGLAYSRKVLLSSFIPPLRLYIEAGKAQANSI